MAWWRDYFDEEYVRLWAATLTPERTEREVRGIMDLLKLPPGSRVLDLGCGYGRILIPIAQRSAWHVTGLDIRFASLQQAQRAWTVNRSGGAVTLVQGDMRAQPFQETFDAVLSIFSSFGYFDTEEDDRAVLQEAARVIRPGGMLLLDTLHRDYVIRQYRERDWWDLAGTHILEQRAWDTQSGRMHLWLRWYEPTGRQGEKSAYIRIYTVTELVRLLQEVGFLTRGVYGDFTGQPVTVDSPHVVLVASKADR